MKELLKNAKIINIDNFKYNIKDFYKDNNIDINILKLYNNWIKINNKWYYFKKIKSEEKLLNELLGVELAILFNLKTIKYDIAKKEIDTSLFYKTYEYGLLSENFKDKNSKYLDVSSDSLFFDNKNLSILNKLYFYCSNEQYYNLVLDEIFRMTIFDFYRHEKDRFDFNLFFEKYDTHILLGHLHDYELSYNSLDFFKYNNANALLPIDFPSNEFEYLLSNYDNFYNYLKFIEIINLKEIIQNIENKYNIKFSKENIDNHLEVDNIKKKLVYSYTKKCL